MTIRNIGRAAAAVAVTVALSGALAACNTDTSAKGGTTTAASGKATAAAPTSKTTKPKAHAPSLTSAQKFKAYIAKNGTASEKAAARHVVKVQGGDRLNNIMDTAGVYTDFTGDITSTSATGAATLLAASFRDYQASRGKSSKNGLVTVYNATGGTVGNGQF